MKSLNVSRETIDSLCEYESMLSKWNSKINLISKNTFTDIWNRHFLDSGQIIKQISKELNQSENLIRYIFIKVNNHQELPTKLNYEKK